MTVPGQLRPLLQPDDVVGGHYQLALFLRGSEDSFTGQLLFLIAKADPGNKAKLRRSFPYEVAVFDLWSECDPAPTYRKLLSLVDTVFKNQSAVIW